MDAKAFDKSRLLGRRATEGPARAQLRAYNCVMGLEPNLEKVKLNRNQRVVCPVSQPISPLGCVVGLQGSLAPDGAIVKVAGMTKLQFRGPARAVDCAEDCFPAVENCAYEEGDVLVICCEGPKGGPSTREPPSTTSPNPNQSGALRKCADEVGSAHKGAGTRAGGKAEVICYADI